MEEPGDGPEYWAGGEQPPGAVAAVMEPAAERVMMAEQPVANPEPDQLMWQQPSPVAGMLPVPDRVEEEPVPDAGQLAYADEPQSERVMAEEPQPERVMTNEPQPERVMADGPQPERVVANEPQPERVMADRPHPERVMAERPGRCQGLEKINFLLNSK